MNHPNIAAIYGLEEDNDTRFLVLELVEGDTLADRLKRGAIPVEESLKLALQIAEALEAAHEKAVIHRDLKPTNIKITPDGKVKVLDFGLAKAFAGDQSDVNLSHSPTLSMQATQQGVILGTAAYMSPEQAKGLPADKRADVFAFGCVLYEMLTGRQTWQSRRWCGKRGLEAAADLIDQDWDRMVTFYNYPKQQWQHLRTTNPVESPFSALRLRTDAARRFKKVANARAVIWKMLLVAEKRFRRLKAPHLMKDVYQGAQYVNGVPVNQVTEEKAA